MPIPLRGDFDAEMVRAAARRQGWAAGAAAFGAGGDLRGARRTEAAKIGGVTLQIVRDWVIKFNAHGPEGLIDRKAPGQPPRLNDAHRAALAAIIESGPIPAVHGVVRWRIVDLCQWMFEEFRVVIAKQTLSRELRAMGYRKLSARPRHHAQAAGAIDDFKKVFPVAWKRSRARRASAQRHRDLVRRRGARRPEEQDHPALGQARHASERSQRSANRLRLYLRRDLPQGRQGRSPRHAPMRHRGDESAPRRNRHPDRAGRACRAARRSGRLASVGRAHRATQHHPDPVTGKMPRTEPAGKHLAVHARKLALEPGLRIVRRHRRPLLRCMEQAHRPAMAHHVDRAARLGLWVVISKSWYKCKAGLQFALEMVHPNCGSNTLVIVTRKLTSNLAGEAVLSSNAKKYERGRAWFFELASEPLSKILSGKRLYETMGRVLLTALYTRMQPSGHNFRNHDLSGTNPPPTRWACSAREPISSPRKGRRSLPAQARRAWSERWTPARPLRVHLGTERSGRADALIAAFIGAGPRQDNS